MDEALVSVIVPCYNVLSRKANIDACLRSALAQRGLLEVIAVDDGSTDGTGEKLEAVAREDARVRVLHQENGGVSAARNAGLEAARGCWVFFADADDTLEENALGTLLDEAKEQDDIVCGAYTVVYTEQGNRTQLFTPTHGDKQAVLESLIRTQSALNSMCARLYRRAYLNESGIRAPRGVKVGEDVLFNLYAFDGARAYTLLDRSVYRYLLGGDSAMGAAQNNFFASQRAMLEGIDRFLTETNRRTLCFRAHADTVLRQLRRGYGRLGAAVRFHAEAAHVLRDVSFLALGGKEKLVYLIARFAGPLSVLLP